MTDHDPVDVLPAIDILAGKAVRLQRGEQGTEQVFGDPIDFAHRLKDCGVSRLHVIDLGAVFGEAPQTDLIQEMGKVLPMQVGGGIRSRDALDAILQTGVYKVIVGTLAFRDPPALEGFTDKVIVAMDVGKDRCPRVEGWRTLAPFHWKEIYQQFREMGLGSFLCTGTDRDGMMRGPDLNLYQEWRNRIGWDPHIIAAGGVRNHRDISACLAAGANAVVVGRGLYEGTYILPGFTP